MKTLFFLIALGNIVYFLWVINFVAQPVERLAASLEPPGGEKILLFGEKPPEKGTTASAACHQTSPFYAREFIRSWLPESGVDFVLAAIESVPESGNRQFLPAMSGFDGCR